MKSAQRTAALGALSTRWLNRKFSFRRRAVRRLVQKSGFAPAAAEAMLDSLFRELTASKLKQLVRVEAGSLRRLDAARAPRQITHVLAGNVPNPGVQSLIHGLLVGSLNVLKPSSRDEGIVDLYAASLRRSAPSLAASCRLLKPDDRTGLRKAIAASDLVIAYGSDESVAAVRAQVPRGIPFCGYGHRVSFSVITSEAQTPAVARRTALDVWMMDRRGCLSPALIFIEDAKKTGEFCHRILVGLERLEKKEGKVQSDPMRAAAVRTAFQEARLDGGTLVQTKNKRYFVRICSPKNKAWTSFGADCRLYGKISEVYRALKPFSRVLQAVALECSSSRRPAITRKLADLGFNRICRAGALQFPPATWPHDGRPNFAAWLKPPRKSGKIRR